MWKLMHENICKLREATQMYSLILISEGNTSNAVFLLPVEDCHMHNVQCLPDSWRAGVSQPSHVNGPIFVLPALHIYMYCIYGPHRAACMPRANVKPAHFKGQRLFYGLTVFALACTVEQRSTITTTESKMPVRQRLASKMAEEHERVNEYLAYAN